MLFPALGFFDAQFQALFQVSDHLQYTALPAIVALIAAAVASRGIAFRPVAIILIALFSILCFKRAGVFQNEEKLMTDSVSKNPEAWGSLNDLAVIYANKMDYAKAMPLFEQSVKYNPDNIEARWNYGYALLLQKDYGGAEAQYLAALKINPHDGVANRMYARLLQSEGRNAEAIRHYQISISFSPDIDTCLNLANLDYVSGNWDRAAMDLRRALSFKPDPAKEVEVLNNLAWVLATCPDGAVRNGLQAIRYAEEACRMTAFKQSGDVNTLAAAYAEAGRFPDAITTAEMALRLATDAGDTGSAATIRKLLAQYQAGQTVPGIQQVEGHSRVISGQAAANSADQTGDTRSRTCTCLCSSPFPGYRSTTTKKGEGLVGVMRVAVERPAGIDVRARFVVKSQQSEFGIRDLRLLLVNG